MSYYPGQKVPTLYELVASKDVAVTNLSISPYFSHRTSGLTVLLLSRVLQAGEELTSDYETFDSCADGTTFECMCGAAACRRVIKG